MYSEDDYIQLSAIQHYVFCPRQCALIHVQGIWDENMFTAKGKVMHEKVDSGEDESRGEKQILRSLNVYSKRLGLSGRCDVVEMFSRVDDTTPYPVEYKSGKPKNDISDMAQLCAQALCLEEMMNIPVRKAAIFYGKPRRRLEVEIHILNSTPSLASSAILSVQAPSASGLPISTRSPSATSGRWLMQVAWLDRVNFASR